MKDYLFPIILGIIFILLFGGLLVGQYVSVKSSKENCRRFCEPDAYYFSDGFFGPDACECRDQEENR